MANNINTCSWLKFSFIKETLVISFFRNLIWRASNALAKLRERPILHAQLLWARRQPSHTCQLCRYCLSSYFRAQCLDLTHQSFDPSRNLAKRPWSLKWSTAMPVDRWKSSQTKYAQLGFQLPSRSCGFLNSLDRRFDLSSQSLGNQFHKVGCLSSGISFVA